MNWQLMEFNINHQAHVDDHPEVIAAKQKALDAGVPLSKGYKSPYFLKRNTNIRVDNPYMARVEREALNHWKEHGVFPLPLYDLCFVSAMIGFGNGPDMTADLDKAIRMAVDKSVRHFIVMSMSEDPKHPIQL